MVTKEYVRNNFLTPKGRVYKHVLDKINNDIDLLKFFNNLYSDSESLKESIIRYANNLDIRPVCKICGKPVKFDNDTKFKTYCSKSCEQNDPKIKAKNAASVSNALKKAYKERGNEIKEKRSKTLGLLDNCGSPFKLKSVQDKVKQNLIDKYGVDNAFKLKTVKEKSKESIRKKSIQLWKERGYDIYYEDEYVIVKNCCEIHGDVKFPIGVFCNRFKPERRYVSIPCIECHPLSSFETSIEIKIKNILEKYNIQFIQHDRNVIKPKELDFYLPEYRIGIECNGMFWHSNDKISHINKWNLCKENNIKLLYFWEIDIMFNIDKIEDIILSLTNKNKRIFARNCEIKNISSKESKEFIENNHLMGNINSSIRYGLFYNDELVEVMTFGKLRKNLGQNSIEGKYELYRLCTKRGYNVIGGASKLLTYFKRHNNWNEIISYANCDISNGNVYEKLGFKFIKHCGVSFFYCDYRNYKIINRFSLRRSIIENEENKELSTKDILQDKNIITCYNSGVLKYSLVND